MGAGVFVAYSAFEVQRLLLRVVTGGLGPCQLVTAPEQDAVPDSLAAAADTTKGGGFRLPLPNPLTYLRRAFLAATGVRDLAVTYTGSRRTDATNIGILASVAVPDTLKLDLTQPIGYPNGRDPDDDVIDTLLFFIFNQVAVSDGVAANDAPFLDVFPFLANPFQAL